MSDLYILINNEPTGPFSLADLNKMVASGEVSSDTLCAEDGAAKWEPLATIIQPAPAPGIPTETELDPDAEINRCELLSDSLQAVSSFPVANEWRQKVAEEVKFLPATLNYLDELIAAGLSEVTDEMARFQNQSFFKRTFGSHEGEDAAKQRVSLWRDKRSHLAGLVADLQKLAAVVPDSPAQRDFLVKDLRQHIKELRLDKQETTAAISEIRREARVASANAGNWLIFYNSGQAARQRRGIRLAREDALRPHEDTKMTIERQIIELEKHLNWLQRLQ